LLNFEQPVLGGRVVDQLLLPGVVSEHRLGRRGCDLDGEFALLCVVEARSSSSDRIRHSGSGHS
jgi:hypothetical protein